MDRTQVLHRPNMFKNVLLKISRPVAFKWLGRGLFGTVLLVQVLILNQYLVLYEEKPSLHAFFLAYGPAIILWAKGQMNERQREVAAGVWFLYIIPLCIQSGWILGKLLSKIGIDSSGLDHGFLNYPLSATALVYLFLDAEEFEPRLHMDLNWPIIVDILDIVNLLDVIVDQGKKETLPDYVLFCICAFTIISLVILTFSFATPVREALQNTDRSNKSQIRICTVYTLVQAISMNFPFLVIRLVLHYNYKAGSSVFAFKNLIVIVTNITKVCFDLCEKKAAPAACSTPPNTEDSGSVAQSTHFSHLDDVSSIASSVRRPNRAEERRSRLLQEIDEREDPEEIIVIS